MANIKTDNFISTLEEWFKKGPVLSPRFKGGLVKYIPIINLIFGVLFILTGVTSLGFSPLALIAGVRSSGILLIGGLGLIISGVLMFMAYSKLKAGKIEGWKLLFWSTIVSIVATLLTGDILNGVILGVVGLYFLFQIKSSYH
jgi:hypothetical protein